MPGGLPGVGTVPSYSGGLGTAFNAATGGRGSIGRLLVALLGSFMVAAGLFLLGSAVLNTILVPAGGGLYSICGSNCSAQVIPTSSGIFLTFGIILIVFGGIIRRLGRQRRLSGLGRLGY
jgi:hypothetical protein